MAIYDLSDPELPAAVARFHIDWDQARDLAFTDGLERIVTVGRNNVRTLSFDGAAIASDGTHNVSEAYSVDYRGVSLTRDAGHALAAWFSNSRGAPAAIPLRSDRCQR